MYGVCVNELKEPGFINSIFTMTDSGHPVEMVPAW